MRSPWLCKVALVVICTVSLLTLCLDCTGVDVCATMLCALILGPCTVQVIVAIMYVHMCSFVHRLLWLPAFLYNDIIGFLPF